MEAAAEMALATRDSVSQRRWPSGAPMSVRIGIACGPVIAGVIGHRKFAYGVCGDGEHGQQARVRRHGPGASRYRSPCMNVCAPCTTSPRRTSWISRGRARRPSTRCSVADQPLTGRSPEPAHRISRRARRWPRLRAIDSSARRATKHRSGPRPPSRWVVVPRPSLRSRSRRVV